MASASREALSCSSVVEEIDWDMDGERMTVEGLHGRWTPDNERSDSFEPFLEAVGAPWLARKAAALVGFPNIETRCEEEQFWLAATVSIPFVRPFRQHVRFDDGQTWVTPRGALTVAVHSIDKNRCVRISGPGPAGVDVAAVDSWYRVVPGLDGGEKQLHIRFRVTRKSSSDVIVLNRFFHLDKAHEATHVS